VAAGLAVYGEPAPDVAEVYWFHAWGALLEHQLGDEAAGDAHLERLVERLRDPDAPAVAAFVACRTSAIPRIARITGRARWLDVAAEASEQRLTRFHFGGVEALTHAGLVAVARGDVDEAGRLHDELLRVQEDSRAWLARSAGLMALTAGKVDAALEHFDESYAFTRDAGYRPEQAWCCCDQADALLARGAAGDTARARLLLEEGRALAAELGMKPLEARVVSRLGKLSPAFPAAFPDGLTGREVEVLRLVARGLTNKAIAFELSISINTVATHLKHVSAKTGCANRAEATAYCLRRGVGADAIRRDARLRGPP
jgi:ATP/maltotriose-dependent transcriptional regulator MalT